MYISLQNIFNETSRDGGGEGGHSSSSDYAKGSDRARFFSVNIIIIRIIRLFYLRINYFYVIIYTTYWINNKIKE